MITENRAKFLDLHDINTHLKKLVSSICTHLYGNMNNCNRQKRWKNMNTNFKQKYVCSYVMDIASIKDNAVGQGEKETWDCSSSADKW